VPALFGEPAAYGFGWGAFVGHGVGKVSGHHGAV
jgi:hypothetical protein